MPTLSSLISTNSSYIWLIGFKQMFFKIISFVSGSWMGNTNNFSPNQLKNPLSNIILPLFSYKIK